MSSCPWHGFDSIDCKPCQENSARIDKQMIAEGNAAYCVLPWRSDGKYTVSDAVGRKRYKNKPSAQKCADRSNEIPSEKYPNGFVVRFCLTIKPKGQE